MLNEAQLRQRDAETGQASLFGEEDGHDVRHGPELPEVDPWSDRDRLREEKERLGFYISGHPLERYQDLVDLYSLEATTACLADLRDQAVEVPCVITDVTIRTSRRDGREWARVTVEDFHGTATVLVFGDTWLDNRELLLDDRPILVTGTVSGNSRDDDDPPIFLDSVQLLSEVHEEGGIGILIELNEDQKVQPGAFERARKLLEGSPGRGPLLVDWHEKGNGANQVDSPKVQESFESEVEPPRRFSSKTLRVEPNAGLVSELRNLLGENVCLLYTSPSPRDS